ncbi:MAG: endo-1,4-beta-xylanase [Treponema sp.]|jgi:endo-1,4-beta-xylanase|nr:endo-1,4-beta-xylanase [Treponema sp.]
MNKGLKDVYRQSFKVGAAVCRANLEQKEASDLILQHFSSLTAENSMKFASIHPQEDVFNWEEADFIADYARQNGLIMRGHTILWHNQTPSWVFVDGGEAVSKTKLFKRLEDHIAAVTQRYEDTVYAWDVLNEVIDTDKGDDKNFRISEWYKIGGREVFEFAFKAMRAAAPKAKLFYNDYNNESGEKMEANIRFLSSLLDAGIPIDGVGLQGHWYYNLPDEKTLRTALERYSTMGLDIEFTEVDISLYQYGHNKEKSEFFTSCPQDRLIEQGKRYKEIFLTASEFPAVKNITTWGIADNYTWLDDFPVKERKNWPLLFDEHYHAKDVVAELVNS